MTSRALAGMVAMAAFATTLVGCAGSTKLSASKMCAAAGGTYNTATQTCDSPAPSRKAADMCQAHGGYYDPNAQVCEVGRE